MATEPKRSLRILVVDDDRDIRESLVDVLQDEGYSVAEAHDGLRALEYLDSGATPDLILLDVMMPRMDAYEFRKEQLNRAALADIPVAVLTADGNAADKAKKLGATAFMRKPLDIEKLLALVQRVLSEHSSDGPEQ